MPLKNPDGSYSIERRLPGYGNREMLRRTRLGTKKKAEATALEKAILEVYRRATYENPNLFVLLRCLSGTRARPEGRALRPGYPGGPSRRGRPRPAPGPLE